MSLPRVDQESARPHLDGAPHVADVIPFPEQNIDDQEHIHGHFETVVLFVDQFIKLKQVRGERNGALQQLKDSIQRRVESGRSGLINQFDTVRVDEETLQQYVEFTNTVWKGNVDIADLEHGRQPDGSYYLVNAGHTRHEALSELEAEGAIPRWRVEAKVHPITSIDEFIEQQLDENIHTQPPRERRAIAIIESYYWGLKSGAWANQKEYLSQHSDVSKTTLSEALAFSNLPSGIRDFVLSGKMSYNAGLELGKAAGELEAYLFNKAGVTLETATPEDVALVGEALEIELIVEANHIANSRMNSTAAEKRVRSWRERMRREQIADADERAAAEHTALFDLDLKTPTMILAEALAAKRREVAEFVRQYGRRPGHWASDMIELNRAHVPEDVIAEAVADFQQAVAKNATLMGGSAMIESFLVSNES